MDRHNTRKKRLEIDEELNLTAFIDIFVTLIVFLLLSTVFVHLGSISLETPGTLSEKTKDGIDPKREISAWVSVQADGLSIRVYDTGKNSERLEFKRKFGWNKIADFSKMLGRLKSQEGGLTRILFQVSNRTPYKRAIQTLEAIEKAELSRQVVLAAPAAGGLQ